MNNILNQKYEEVFGYGMEQFSFYTGFNLKLN